MALDDCLDVLADLYRVVSVDDGGKVLNKVLLEPWCLSTVTDTMKAWNLGLRYTAMGKIRAAPSDLC